MLRNVQHNLRACQIFNRVEGRNFRYFCHCSNSECVLFFVMILPIWKKNQLKLRLSLVCIRMTISWRTQFFAHFFFQTTFLAILWLSSFVHSQNPNYMTVRPLYLAIVKSRSAQTMRYKKKQQQQQIITVSFLKMVVLIARMR